MIPRIFAHVILGSLFALLTGCSAVDGIAPINAAREWIWQHFGERPHILGIPFGADVKSFRILEGPYKPLIPSFDEAFRLDYPNLDNWVVIVNGKTQGMVNQGNRITAIFLLKRDERTCSVGAVEDLLDAVKRQYWLLPLAKVKRRGESALLWVSSDSTRVLMIGSECVQNSLSLSAVLLNREQFRPEHHKEFDEMLGRMNEAVQRRL